MRRNRVRYIIILVCVLSAAAALFSAGYRMWHNQKAEQLYQNICTQLEQYPRSLPVDGCSVCYFRDGAEEYLFFWNDGVTIAGRRNQEGEIYYVGESVCVDKTGTEVESTFSKQAFLDAIEEGIAFYLNQTDVTYSYHKPSGGALPMWISPLDPCYLRIQRTGHPDYMEVMTGYEGETGTYLHWNILTSDETVVLYVSASDISASYGRTYVPGWGEIPTQLIDRWLPSF